MKYIGEQLIWGQIGSGLIFTAFISALFAAILYIISTVNESKATWMRPLARKFFVVHAVAVYGVFFLLLYLIFNHRFEYFYVWQHSSLTMPMHFILPVSGKVRKEVFLLDAVACDHCIVHHTQKQTLGSTGCRYHCTGAGFSCFHVARSLCVRL
ncbi:MAG: hypothetical protein R2847_02665 [Bacteroidia bacterium]